MLNFQPVTPLIDISFWLWFTQKKLDEGKLECPVQDIEGAVSMPPSDKVGANLILSKTNEQIVSTGGILEFAVKGKLIHYNTIEEYNMFDFKDISQQNEAFLDKYGLKEAISSTLSSFSNMFILACFGDLKTYKFHYKTGYLQ